MFLKNLIAGVFPLLAFTLFDFVLADAASKKPCVRAVEPDARAADYQAYRNAIETELLRRDSQYNRQKAFAEKEGMVSNVPPRFGQERWMTPLEISRAISDYNWRLKNEQFNSAYSFRNLAGYKEVFGQDFTAAIADILKNGGGWVDYGGGPFAAASDFFKLTKGKPNVSRMFYRGYNHEDIISPRNRKLLHARSGTKIEQVVGDYLKFKFIRPVVKEARVFTSLYGVPTYAPYVDGAIFQMASEMPEGSRLFLNDKWGLIHFVDRSGRRISHLRWLNQIQGLILEESSLEHEPDGSPRPIILRRTSEKVTVPDVKLVYFGPGLPRPIPRRVYFYEM